MTDSVDATDAVEADVARLLELARRGDSRSHEALFAALYKDLRIVARGMMRHEPPEQTLQATALVHEVFLNLSRGSTPWEGRRHFFAVAARSMRRVLVDRARSRKRRRRTMSDRSRTHGSIVVEYENRAIDVIALDDAMRQLAAEDERAASVVELRFFGRLSLPQVARTLAVPLRTVERDWQWARAFLHAKLS